MNLLLQAAYKVIDVPVHSCYDIGKDYLMPVLGSVLAFAGAYGIMCWQQSKNAKAEKGKEDDNKIIFSDFLGLTLDKILIENDSNVLIFNRYLEELKFDKRHTISRYLINQSGIKTIIKIEESKIHWTFTEKSKDKDFRRSLSDYFTEIQTLNDTYIFFNKNFEDFLVVYNTIGVEINNMYSLFYKEFDLLIQSDEVHSNNILIIQNGWFDKKLLEFKDKCKNEHIDVSAFKLMSNLIDEIFDYCRESGVKQQDQLFLQNHIVEIKIKLNQLKLKYENFTANTKELIRIVQNCNNKLQKFRQKIS
ncbi:hypothetical protein ABE426_04455 [Sphingobacterium faecium]|uniref:hypothetical protein n=1 Tax=Sphingobacterium faecium TaxID=34087 RepID=UPI003207C5F5